MKSKTFLFNKAVWKRNMTGYAGLGAGFLLVYMAVLPVTLFLSLSVPWMDHSSKEEILEWKVSEMITSAWNMNLFVPLFAVTALFTAMMMFSYLFTGRNANMMHTYPVNRLSLFCTNYISGVVYLAVPQAAGMLLALLAGAYRGAVTGTVVRYYLLWLGTALAESVFFFSMAVCVLMFSGNIIAVPVFYIILNFLYKGCLLTADAMVNTLCFGLDRGNFGGGWSNMLTPVLYMRRHIGLSDGTEGDKWHYEMYGEKELFVYLAAAVVLAAAAMVVYKKKQLETAGDIITVGWLKPVFRWGASVCISALGALLVSGMTYRTSLSVILASAAVVGVLVFFIAQMLLERSMRVFTRKKIVECAACIACICVVYIGLDADILGLEKKIPDAQDVQAAVVRGGLTLYTEDPEETAWVMDIHRQIIQSKKEFEAAEEDSDLYASAEPGDEKEIRNTIYVYIDYILKDGTELNRSYRVPYLGAGSLNEQISAYALKPDIFLRKYFGVHYPDIEVYSGTLEIYAQDGEEYEYQDSDGAVRLSQRHAERLYKALVRDAEAGHTAGGSKELGLLSLDIRDEQGYKTADHSADYFQAPSKEAVVDIWIDDSYTYLFKALEELGYLTEKK